MYCNCSSFCCQTLMPLISVPVLSPSVIACVLIVKLCEFDDNEGFNTF